MRGPSRCRAVAFARFEAAFWIRQMVFADGKPPSYQRIARWLGRTDPTSALHMVRRHAELMAANDG